MKLLSVSRAISSTQYPPIVVRFSVKLYGRKTTLRNVAKFKNEANTARNPLRSVERGVDA